MKKKHSSYLALILARAGSKRLKNKNILKLKKKTLTEITIEKLKKIEYLFKDILISSDSTVIKKIAKKKNILFLDRPKYLSHGKVSSEAAALHAVNYYEKKYCKIKYIILFQVTSPFRRNLTIKKAINLSKKFPNKQIVGVNKDKVTPNGVIYLTPKKLLKKYKHFSKSKKFIPLVIKSNLEKLDIDYKSDFEKAKNFSKKNI